MLLIVGGFKLVINLTIRSVFRATPLWFVIVYHLPTLQKNEYNYRKLKE